VRFRVTGDLERVTYCNCSLCSKKGYLHLIVPPSQFECLSGRDALTPYRFGSMTAEHTFCRVCGVQPFYVPRSDPDKIDVNARCLDDFGSLSIAPKQFDGRNWEDAMQNNVPWR
jgi:hypothetical protein